MNLKRIAILFPKPELTLDGTTHNSDSVDVRALTGEHELDGQFAFRQMTADDYEWVAQQKAAEVAAVTKVTVDLLVVEKEKLIAEKEIVSLEKANLIAEKEILISEKAVMQQEILLISTIKEDKNAIQENPVSKL
jgi:RNA polymerase-interacting CarD/CdnL/TRCF family regulator